MRSSSGVALGRSRASQAVVRQPRPVSFIGNDVVDLEDIEARGKAQDQRFVARICVPAERRLLRQVDPGPDAAAVDRALWRLWTAKEAAYKVAQKAWGAFFSPRAFVIHPRDKELASSSRAWVIWRGHRMEASWQGGADVAHCVVRSIPDLQVGRSQWAVRSINDSRLDGASLTDNEALSAGHPQSARVRRLAQELLRKMRGPEVEITRAPGQGRLGPPRAMIDGSPLSGCDLSLSHHGRFVAAAVWRA